MAVDAVATSARTVAAILFRRIGPGLRIFALSQGHFTPGHPEGSPADPNTGALVELRRDGSFRVVVEGLNQPTSLEIIGDTAYVVTLGGEIWTIGNVSR